MSAPVDYWHGITCRTVVPLIDAASSEKVCPICGTRNGYVVPHDEFAEGFDAGTYFNIDPRTGRRAKKRRP